MAKVSDVISEAGRPVAYYPALTTITGGVTATLFLCQLIYWRGKEADPNGWMYKTQEDWTAELGLSRCEQETARRNLISRGLLEEERRGIPCRLWYRVNLDMLNTLWEKHLSTTKNDSTPQTSLRESSKQECGKVANKSAGFPQTITETTTKNTPENTDHYGMNAKSAFMRDAPSASPTKHEEHSSLKANKDTSNIDIKRDKVTIPVVNIIPAASPAPVLAALPASAPLMATASLKPSKPAMRLKAKQQPVTEMLASYFFQMAKLPYTQGEFRRAQKEFRELTKPSEQFLTFDAERIRDCIRTLAEHGVKMTGPGIIAKVIVAFVADDDLFPPKWCEPKTQRQSKKERERLAEYRRLSNLPITPNNLEAGYAAVAAKRASQGLRSETPPTCRAASQQTTDSSVL